MATAVLTSKTAAKTKKIKQEDYARIVLINEILPFRVRFTSIGIEGYSPNNVPPIPLQVIGYSNYIL
ncbi:MAG: hypothetical protein RL348_51 [Bacteroidota bacterium]|jgi:hypothetical protein